MMIVKTQRFVIPTSARYQITNLTGQNAPVPSLKFLEYLILAFALSANCPAANANLYGGKMNRDEILIFIRKHLLIQCVQCKKITFRKNVILEFHNVANRHLPLCKECHNQIFKPFSKKDTTK